MPDKLDHLLEEANGEQADAEAKAEEDPLYEAARELAMQHSRISTSLLQRRLHIGYPRAARLIDMLEEEGVVSEAEAGQSRQVLVADDTDDSGDRRSTAATSRSRRRQLNRRPAVRASWHNA